MNTNRIRRVVPNITSDCLEATSLFYAEFLGFRVAMDMGWIITFCSPNDSIVQISVVKGDPSTQHSITLSIEVDDVDILYKTALERAYEIVHPLTDEAWGVRRFHVKDPNGVVINVMRHKN